MKNEVWKYFGNNYKVYTENTELKNKIIEWQGCDIHGIYQHQNKVIGWDIIFPSHFYNRVARLAGFVERQKNCIHQKQGKTMAEKNSQYRFGG